MFSDTQMNLTFRALASPTRRQILDVVKATPGVSLGGIAKHFAMSRIAVMRHLRILEEADLVRSTKEGRLRRHYVNAVPIQAIYERWMTTFSGLWAAQLTRGQRELERSAADTPVYEGVPSQ